MADVIRAVRWRLQFPIGYRDLKRMLADRGWIIRAWEWGARVCLRRCWAETEG